jgi:hypothetical protein
MRINRIIVLSVAIAALITTNLAIADVIVGSGPLEQPTGGLELSYTFINDPTKPFTDPVFTVPNVPNPDMIKHFWMEVKMNSMNAFPQVPGSTFDPLLWPTVTAPAPSAVTITAVSDEGSNNTSGPWNFYLTATIIPQPQVEWVTFPAEWWRLWGDHITEIDVHTSCVPEPSGAIALCGLGGMGLIGLVWRRRKVG